MDDAPFQATIHSPTPPREPSLSVRPARIEGHELDAIRCLVGHSAAMGHVRALVLDFARSNSSVLVHGDTGTGKELVARALHAAGPNPREPFVAVNVAAIAPALVTSELFGHVRGSFTGATRDHLGLFLAARRGTLFLDEIGDMPLDVQAHLLRALESREVRATGATSSRPFLARVVAATHRDLRERVRQGLFREDLLYRLDVLSIRLPALRARLEDIPLLVTELVARTGVELDRAYGARTLAPLLDHTWPGNVRELANIVARALVFARGRAPQTAHFTQALGHGMLREHAARKPPRDAVSLRALLDAHGGSIRATARTIGIARSTLRGQLDRAGVAIHDPPRRAPRL